MLSKTKKMYVAAITAVVLLMPLLMACPPPPPVDVVEPPEVIRIGWAPPDVTGVFRTALDWMVMSATDAREHGILVDIITQAPVSHTAFGEQVAILEDFVARRVDAIMVSPIEVDVVIPAIRKANEAGIPVIAVNLLTPIPGVEVASYIGFSNVASGEICAWALVDYVGGPGVLGEGPRLEVAPDTFLDAAFWENVYKGLSQEEIEAITARVAIIEGVPGGYFSVARVRGIHNVLDRFPGIEVVKMLPGNWRRDMSIAATEDFLTAFPPGELDAIIAPSNEMGLGAMLAAEAAGRLELAGQGVVGDAYVAIFTNGVTAESVARMREGKIIAEATHGFPDWGWYGTEFAVTLAHGGQIPPMFDIRARMVYPGNVHLFHPVPILLPIDWEAIKRGESPRL